jgi:hypothetical protein
MISIGDVVKTRIAETASETSSLRDFISAAIRWRKVAKGP